MIYPTEFVAVFLRWLDGGVLPRPDVSLVLEPSPVAEALRLAAIDHGWEAAYRAYIRLMLIAADKRSAE